MSRSNLVSARRRPWAAVALVLVALLAAGVTTGVGSGPGSGLSAADAATVCGGSVGEGQIRVVVVVDPGPGAPGGAAATCLVVARGTTGAQLLAERSAALGGPRPRYADSGLLCGLDGYPSTGCGDRTADGYRYWAYFSGTSGSWEYGSGNPFIRRVADGDVEGWRFVDGTGTGQDPPPRLPATGLFPPLPPAPSATVPPLPAPSAAGGATAPPAGAAAGPGATSPGSPGATGSRPAGSGGPSSGDQSTGGSTTIVGATPGVAEGRYGPAPPGTVGDASDEEAADLAAAVAASSSSPVGPIGALVAGVVIAVLVVATVLRSRARR